VVGVLTQDKKRPRFLPGGGHYRKKLLPMQDEFSGPDGQTMIQDALFGEDSRDAARVGPQRLRAVGRAQQAQ
jgi:hypothetical protein